MPRSELLARLNELQSTVAPKPKRDLQAVQAEQLKAAREIVTSLAKLEDLPVALSKLEELTKSEGNSTNSPALSSLTLQLRSMNRTYEDIKQGLATRMVLSSIKSGSGYEETEVTMPLRQKLLMFAIPRVLGLDEGADPKPSENAPTYLQRILALAKAREDWPVVLRTVELAGALELGTVTGYSDTTALRSFLAGLNQERAGQNSLAVASYQAALKSGSDIVAPALIGTHLAAIKKSTPEEFEKGMQLTLNPVPSESRTWMDPRASGRSSGYPPGYPYPGQSSPPPPPASPVLDIPAKPAAAPTPPAPAK